MDFDNFFDNLDGETSPTNEKVEESRERLLIESVTLSDRAERFLSSLGDNEVVLLWRPLDKDTKSSAMGKDNQEEHEGNSPGHISLQIGYIEPKDRLQSGDGGDRFLSFGTSGLDPTWVLSHPTSFPCKMNTQR